MRRKRTERPPQDFAMIILASCAWPVFRLDPFIQILRRSSHLERSRHPHPELSSSVIGQMLLVPSTSCVIARSFLYHVSPTVSTMSEHPLRPQELANGIYNSAKSTTFNVPRPQSLSCLRSLDASFSSGETLTVFCVIKVTWYEVHAVMLTLSAVEQFIYDVVRVRGFSPERSTPERTFTAGLNEGATQSSF